MIIQKKTDMLSSNKISSKSIKIIKLKIYKKLLYNLTLWTTFGEGITDITFNATTYGPMIIYNTCGK